MTKNNIIIAFSSQKINEMIANVLNENGIYSDYICKSITELRNVCSYYESGIIICSTKFNKSTTIEIIDDFYDKFRFIIIDNAGNLNIFDYNVYKLITPIKHEDLILAINIYFSNNNLKIKKDVNKYIDIAKKLLFINENMTENIAHKYIQLMSMKKRKKNIDIAKSIIEKYR